MKINILFLLYKSKTNSFGKCPVRCRITYNRIRKEFSTGIFITPKSWDSKQQIAKPPNEENNNINSQLNLIKTKFNQVFLYLQVNSSEFSIDDIYGRYIGEPSKKEFGLIEVYNNYLLRIEKLIGKDIQQVTFNKYKESLTHLKAYVFWKTKMEDIPINDLKYSFITDYEFFLRTEQNLQISTLNKAIQRFRRVISYGISESLLEKDPFYGYIAKRQKKEIVFLTVKQLNDLEMKSFEIERLQQIKDMFVFCCYTGLGFSEMTNLRYSDITKRFDGNKWLTIKRNKTDNSYYVPILPQANLLIQKYQNLTEFVFPRISNPKFNSYLKEIADVVGIKINLTHHIARKTFATTVLLYNDVPMEVVSELLGHSKLSTTQEHYAKVIQSKLSEQMGKLGNKLSQKE